MTPHPKNPKKKKAAPEKAPHPRPPKTPEGWVQMGVVRRPHGIRGGLKIHLHHAKGDALKKGTLAQLLAPDGRVLKDQIKNLDAGGNLAFEGISDRDQAESWRGAALLIPRDAFPPLSAEEVYLVDLVGARVQDPAGEDLGQVVGLTNNVAQPLLQIRMPAGQEVLFPFVSQLVVRVDEKAGLIVVDPPEGLFAGEAVEARPQKAPPDVEPS